MTDSPRKVIALTLDTHGQSARNNRCECGWRPQWHDPLMNNVHMQHDAHLTDEIVNALQAAGWLSE